MTKKTDPGWQPIATAPKDALALLRFPCDVFCVGQRRYGRLGEPNQDAFEWRCMCCGRYGSPTHWMPLPEPPTAEAHRERAGEG